MGHLGFTLCCLAVIFLVSDGAVINPGNRWKRRQPKLRAVRAKPTGLCTNYPCDASCDMKIAPCNGLIFEDEFNTFDLDTWEHEITAGGGGNWEFQYYINNRTNSYVRDGTLFLKPVSKVPEVKFVATVIGSGVARGWSGGRPGPPPIPNAETLTEETYGDGFVSSGTLGLWGASPANLCTGNAWWGCERVGNPTNYINPIQSARIRSVNSFSFTYGKIEVAAKMPVGDWIWPAIWLLPVNSGYGEWPASGEIDIVESRGNVNLKDGSGADAGVQTVAGTMHWGPFFELNSYDRTNGHSTLVGDHYGNAFHTYTVEWTPTDITFKIDGKQIAYVDPGANGFYGYGDFANRAPNTHNPWENSPNKMAPFDEEFYIIMNVAVGGTGGYFSDGLKNEPYPKPWSDQSSTAPRDFYNAINSWYPTWNPTKNNGEDAAMQVKSIRVWAHGSY